MRWPGKKRRKMRETNALYHTICFSHSNPLSPGRRPPLRRAATLSSGFKGGEGGAPAFMERRFITTFLSVPGMTMPARANGSCASPQSCHTPQMVWMALFFGFPPEREKNTLTRDEALRSPSSVKERRRTPFRRVGAGPDHISGQHPPAPAAPAPHAVPAFLYPTGTAPVCVPGGVL